MMTWFIALSIPSLMRLGGFGGAEWHGLGPPNGSSKVYFQA